MSHLFARSKVFVTALTMATLVAFAGAGHAAEFSDGKLKSFVVAWNNINQLAEQWKPQVEAATSEEQATEMLQQFEVEAKKVIESTDGIEATEYQEIITAAQSDPALNERLAGMLLDVQAE